MGPLLNIQLLGLFRAAYGSNLLETFTSPRLQSLLAYLVLHRGTPQSRQQLAYTFWPDSTDAQARTNLRRLLYDVRRALPDPDSLIDTDGQTIHWLAEGPFELDVAAFEAALDEADEATGTDDVQALERATSLYTGDLLPSCYEDWIRPERERLRARYLDALGRLAQLLEEAGDVRGAIEQAQRLLRHDPLHEPTYRRLMCLHALQGDRAGALHVYHSCVTVLERELGVGPADATQQAYHRLLEAEAAPSPPPPVAGVVHREATPPPEVTVSAPPAARFPGLVTSAPLVGRHPEWAQLVASWERAAQGAAIATLIEGEAGIGKSRLAGELARWLARQGIRVAIARCYAAEGALPYAPVVDWLRALPLPELEPPWLRELARLLPELLDQHPELTVPDAATEPWQRQRLFEALARAVLDASVRSSAPPLLLLLDDLQWCDPDTREWLHYLLRHNPQAPLLVLGTVRTEELDAQHPLLAWIGALRHDEQVTEIELCRLDEEDTLALAEHVTTHDLAPELASCIYAETEGNPLFVIEMVRAGLAADQLEPTCELQALPPRVQGAIEARLGQLSPQARALAGTASAAGRVFSLDLLLAATAMEEDEAIVALDELWQRRIVTEQGRAAYDFTHDKLREVAYASLSPVRRPQLHARLAKALEALHTDDLDSVAAEVAAHYDRAGQPAQAVPSYLRAGDVARQVYAGEEAVRHYERALALLAGVAASEADRWRFEVSSRLGAVHHWAGALARAEGYLRQAVEAWPQSALPARSVADVYQLLGKLLNQSERYREAILASQQAMDLLGEDETSVEAVLARGSMAGAYRGLGDWGAVEKLVTWISTLVDGLPYRTEVSQLYRMTFEVHRRAKRVEEAGKWVRILEARATQHGDLEGLRIAAELTGALRVDRGDAKSAVPLFRRALELGAQIGHVNEQRMNAIRLGYACLELGDLEGAERYARLGLESREELGIGRYLAWSHGLLCVVLYAQGKWRDTIQAMDRALALARQWGQNWQQAESQYLLGRVQLAVRDRDAAVAHLRQAASMVASGPHWQRGSPLRVLAEALSGLEVAYDDPAAYRAFCGELRALARSSDSRDVITEQRLSDTGPWFLEPTIDPKGFPKPLGSVSPDWTWTDPLGDCSYTPGEALVIRAACGRDLWHINLSAPRLTLPAAGNLAIEAVVSPVDAEHLAIGGVLLWIDERNYLRLDVGTRGPDEIHFCGCLANEDRYLGRGQLPRSREQAAARAFLRLERIGGHVRALCSRDRQTWFTAGEAAFPKGEVQAGIHAIGHVDRTVYSGAHAEGTAVRFESVRLGAPGSGTTAQE